MVILGIMHTCTVFWYKQDYICGRVSDCQARDPGSILGRDNRCYAFFHLLHKYSTLSRMMHLQNLF